MNASRSTTSKEVLQAFERWKNFLISSGFSESYSTYYLRGEYDLGPTVIKEAKDLVLLREELSGGRRFWKLAFKFKPQELVWNVDGVNWRLYQFGPNVGKLAFFSNAEARDWFDSESPDQS